MCKHTYKVFDKTRGSAFFIHNRQERLAIKARAVLSVGAFFSEKGRIKMTLLDSRLLAAVSALVLLFIALFIDSALAHP